MTECGTFAGDGAGPKTRYHLLTTDGGIVADQPGKMVGGEAWYRPSPAKATTPTTINPLRTHHILVPLLMRRPSPYRPSIAPTASTPHRGRAYRDALGYADQVMGGVTVIADAD